MRERLVQLAGRIQEECLELRRVVDRIQEGWHRAQRSADDFYIDAVALNVHSFYAGLERMCELIAVTIDGTVPQGANWHQVLLNQMATEVPGVRPAVISEATRDGLDEYRGFRHLVRNVYTFNLDPVKIEKLVERLPEVFVRVRVELLAFAYFLEQQMTMDEEPEAS